jgi:intracellular multiplication protein IcmP
MAQGGGAQKSPHEDMMMVVILCGLLAAIGFGIWHVFHIPLTNLVRYIRIGELWVVELLHGKDYQVFIPDTNPPDPSSQTGMQSVDAWRRALTQADVQDISPLALRASTYLAVPALRPIFSVVIGVMAIWSIFRSPSTQFHRRLTLDTLIKEQAISFPSIAPFINFNPQTLPFRVIGQAVPATLPLFSEALSPEEWITHNEIQMQGNQIDSNQTYQALMKQLGARWQGPDKLSIHAQGLYAACALRHARKRRESEELLGKMALSWTPEGGLKLPPKVKAEIRKIINDPKLGGAIRKYADMHAYETTALLRCLKRARDEGGVLAPASFLWLRGEDRNLWYPLNNLGRRSYHAEATGALVHYTNELIAGQKIPTPRFDEVIKGFQTLITGPMGRPIPPLDKTPPAIAPVKKKSFFNFKK